MLKPKACINLSCDQVIYVPDYKLHMCLQCEKCIARRELSVAIADHGGWEEFHQKQHNYCMYDYHKDNRLKLERYYREHYSQTATGSN